MRRAMMVAALACAAGCGGGGVDGGGGGADLAMGADMTTTSAPDLAVMTTALHAGRRRPCMRVRVERAGAADAALGFRVRPQRRRTRRQSARQHRGRARRAGDSRAGSGDAVGDERAEPHAPRRARGRPDSTAAARRPMSRRPRRWRRPISPAPATSPSTARRRAGHFAGPIIAGKFSSQPSPAVAHDAGDRDAQAAAPRRRDHRRRRRCARAVRARRQRQGNERAAQRRPPRERRATQARCPMSRRR